MEAIGRVYCIEYCEVQMYTWIEDLHGADDVRTHMHRHSNTKLGFRL